MKIKFFQSDSTLYPFRWFIVFAATILLLMTYADVTGWRMASFASGQQWSASGPGVHGGGIYHK